MGMGKNGLTLDPPVFPCGTNPSAVVVVAPTMRKT
jgi:hypothetical protein